MAVNFFSGIGAWDLGVEICEKVFNKKLLAFKSEIVVDNSEEALKIYNQNFLTAFKTLDIRDFQINSNYEVAYVSFPCSGTSVLGKRTGLSHPDSSMWYCCLPTLLKANLIFIEQPSYFEYTGLTEILDTLKANGYSSTVILLTASMFSLPHRRERIFVIASNTHDIHKCYWNKSRWTDSFREKIKRLVNTSKKSEDFIIDSENNNGLPRRVYSKFNLEKHIIGVDKGDPFRWKEINCLSLSIVPWQVATVVSGVIDLP